MCATAANTKRYASFGNGTRIEPLPQRVRTFAKKLTENG